MAEAGSGVGGAIVRLGLLAAGLVAAVVVARWTPLGDQQALLDRWVVGHGWRGVVVFVLAGGVCCAMGVPRQAVCFAAGYVAGAWSGGAWSGGAWSGVALALPAELIGCGLNMLWAEWIAREWARRRLPARIARFGGLLADHPFAATLTIRLLPIGNNLALNLLAGVIGVPAARFLAASALGYLPQTIIFVLLGSGTHVGQRTQIGLGVVLFCGSTLLGMVLLRRYRSAVAGPHVASPKP